MRWLVGDLQGCAREFDRLLSAIRFDPDHDELWTVGDLINRGPDSLATLRLWRDVGGRGVLGNHDVYAVQVVLGDRKRHEDTLGPLFRSAEGEELLAAVAGLPVLARLDADRGVREAWLVHAGLHPGWSDLAEVAEKIHAEPRVAGWFRSAEVSFATRVRCCTEDGEMSRDTGPPAECVEPYRPWDEFYRGPAPIVHGHWATRGHYRGKRTIGLDSGCVYGGPLTAWCQEEDRIVQVPAVAR